MHPGKLQTRTVFIHQRVIVWGPYTLDRPSPKRPVKIISQRALPATATALKGTGSPTILFISAVTAVICEVTTLTRRETSAIVTQQEA